MLLQKGSTKPVGVEGFDRRAVIVCERLNLSHAQNRDLASHRCRYVRARVHRV